jgi:hypothetical protein
VNDKNLIPFSERTESEQREIRSKGGKQSAKNRREQKTYREMAKAMLSATITDENILNELQAYGLSETDVKAYTLLGMIKASGNGSHNAFDRLMMLVGEETQATTSEQEKQANLLKAIQEAVKNGD